MFTIPGSAVTCLQLQLQTTTAPKLSDYFASCHEMRFKLYNTSVLLCVRLTCLHTVQRVFARLFLCSNPLPHHFLSPFPHTATGTGIVIGIESGICSVCEVKVLNKHTQCALNTFLLLSTEELSSAGVRVCKPTYVGCESFVIQF